MKISNKIVEGTVDDPFAPGEPDWEDNPPIADAPQGSIAEKAARLLKALRVNALFQPLPVKCVKIKETATEEA